MPAKSASKFKVAPRKMTREEMEKKLSEEFEQIRTVILDNMKIHIDQCERFDNLLAIHDSYVRFGFEAVTVPTAAGVATDMKALLVKVRDRVSKIALEEMLDRDFENPLDEFVPKTDVSDGTEWIDILNDAIMFSAIKPWGSEIDNAHGKMVQSAYEIGWYKEDEEHEA